MWNLASYRICWSRSVFLSHLLIKCSLSAWGLLSKCFRLICYDRLKILNLQSWLLFMHKIQGTCDVFKQFVKKKRNWDWNCRTFIARTWEYFSVILRKQYFSIAYWIVFLFSLGCGRFLEASSSWRFVQSTCTLWWFTWLHWTVCCSTYSLLFSP